MELTVLDEQEMTITMVQVSQHEKNYLFRLCKTEDFLQVNFIDEEGRVLSMVPIEGELALVEPRSNEEADYIRAMTVEGFEAFGYLENNYILGDIMNKSPLM